MITRHAEAKPVEMLPGLIRRTLADGTDMMLCEFTFDAGVEVPRHTHPHEQVGYVVSGRLRLTVAGVDHELGPGDSYRAAPNVPHGAFTLEPTVVVDVFSPPREDYR
ncbi:MAG: cupin domain-containing protein [Chloroflexi bacterium]|nr:cupin domain-containing protein [Chloroflexota bacterium]MBU1748089.1 cupin domain-containing protein [Chloroflexota bacterium]